MSSVFGKSITLSLFGESHGHSVGAVISGLPSGVKLNFSYINKFIAKRKPNSNVFSTKRLEDDEYEIISGITNGYTNGAPLTVVILNKGQKSGDYDSILSIPRPSHADYTAHVKYGGYNDPFGGGHFSGRLMAPVCFAGAICKQIMEQRGIKIGAHLFSVGSVKDEPFDMALVSESDLDRISGKEIPVVSDEAGQRMLELVKEARSKKDSIGGIIECVCLGLPAGVGSPHFDGVENKISAAVFGIPAVKGIEFGSGFKGSTLTGSENNDEFYIDCGEVKTKTNNSGGILGGISNGMPVIFRVAIKPTPSIGVEQNTVNLKTYKNSKIKISGRHDSCIALRALPCVEAMAAIAVYDMLLEAGV